MNARRTIFILALSLLALAGVAVVLMNKPEPVPEDRISPGTRVPAGEAVATPRPQEAGGRERREAAFREIACIGSVGEAPLMMPLHVRMDAAECVYVLDWSERSVKKYGPDGEFILQFGYGEGKAPGEFTNLSDFDVAPDGSVWACDPVNGLITVFEKDGSLRTTLRPDRSPHRIALLDSETWAVMSSPVGSRIFRVQGSGGRTVAEYGVLMDQQMRLGIALDGRIAATGSGGFAYAAYRAGILAVTTDRGDSIGVYRQTLEHGGLPDVLVSRSGGAEYARTDPDAPVVTRSISCVDGEIHLLVGTDDRPDGAVMDVYDVAEGCYRYSYDLPVDALSACVTRTRLATVSDTTVTVWERLDTRAMP
jgi:hypothetical protein